MYPSPPPRFIHLPLCALSRPFTQPHSTSIISSLLQSSPLHHPLVWSPSLTPNPCSDICTYSHTRTHTHTYSYSVTHSYSLDDLPIHPLTHSLRFLRHHLIEGEYEIEAEDIDEIMIAFDRQDRDNDNDIDVEDILASKMAFTGNALSYRSLSKKSSEVSEVTQPTASAPGNPGSNP